MDFTKINKVAVFKNAKKDITIFKKIGDIEQGEIYKVNGIFPYTSKFGRQFFLSLERVGENDFFNFNLPKDQAENAELLLRSEEAIRAINAGECGVAIRQYYSKKYEKNCVSIEWVNIQ